jgi:hypothetical protein
MSHFLWLNLKVEVAMTSGPSSKRPLLEAETKRGGTFSFQQLSVSQRALPILAALFALIVLLLGAHRPVGSAPGQAGTASLPQHAQATSPGYSQTPTPIPVDKECLMWESPRLVAAPPATEDYPANFGPVEVAVDPEGNGHVVWGSSNAIPYTVGHAVYKVAAHQWQEPVGVNPTAEAAGSLTFPDIAIDQEGVAHTVWSTYQQSGRETILAYSRLHPGENSWSESRPLPTPEGSVRNLFPRLAVDGQEKLHLLWLTTLPLPDPHSEYWQTPAYTTSSDGGITWSPVITVTDRFSATQASPALVVDHQGVVHAMWQELWQRSDVTRYSRLDPATGQWSQSSIMFTELGAFYGAPPALTVDPAGGLHAAILGEAAEIRDTLYYTYLAPGSSEWTTPQILAQPPYSWLSNSADIQADSSGGVHALWVERGTELMYACKPVGRAAWSDPRPIASAETNQYYESVRIAISPAGRAYAAWTTGRVVRAATGWQIRTRLSLPIIRRH